MRWCCQVPFSIEPSFLIFLKIMGTIIRVVWRFILLIPGLPVRFRVKEEYIMHTAITSRIIMR